MYRKVKFALIAIAFINGHLLISQASIDSSLLSLDRIFNSSEFSQDSEREIQWIDNGESYVTIEKSITIPNADELIRYTSSNMDKEVFVPAEALMTDSGSLEIQSFSLSPDGKKVLIFNNSSRVWRSFTKGDYWVYDLSKKQLKQIGKEFSPSSLMFAKFSYDNQYVAYVHQFNIYKENYTTGKLEQLTTKGNKDNIIGTFDWAYEEEFGKRDGFSWSADDQYIAFWRIDATEIGIYYMINYTDSIYSEPIPLQYPKVGQVPSGAIIGTINLNTGKKTWLPLPGDEKQNYLPGMQWINEDLLLIQQINRKQNHLKIWSYIPSSGELKIVYEEHEKSWIELQHPDMSSNAWGNNDLTIVENGTCFLRMRETEDWRKVYKVNINTGVKTLITTGAYDVAAMVGSDNSSLYFMASPFNSTQRYLYRAGLDGIAPPERISPEEYSGVNAYNISSNAKYAIHSHQSVNDVRSVHLISLPEHKIIKTLVVNKDYKEQLEKLSIPEIKFTKVTTEEGIEIDVRMILPIDFDELKVYPVLFHVYGEPWGQVATDRQVGLWNIMMAQKGYVIIDMDNRGTPCLKGSEWRKSIYRKIGVINARDQALAAKEILKLDYLDENRTAVWGWSGGGSMTLNLLFQYPETYQTGVSIASVSNQLLYDNIYQERYMGLPQENEADFIKGSPITYAKNLKGNLLLVHGTGDDNVHYQSLELLANELIKHNKQFQMMAYPNRSHSIREGENTRRHLYTLMTDYILENTPVNAENVIRP